MATSNVSAKREPVFTHEGARAVHNPTALHELKRTVLACLLFEDTFYEGGQTVAQRVKDLVAKCDPIDVATLAIEAREKMYLRHVPLLLVRELARKRSAGAPEDVGSLVRATLARVIQRPDEITEYVALYWKGRAGKREKGKDALSSASRRGLADAFKKFNAYSLAKYQDADKAIKLRDVLRLVRPKPADAAQSALFKGLRTGTLETPDTWETELSSGKGKKETFERLLTEKKLGGLAFLRNLRNMEQAGVDKALIEARFAGDFNKVLPFRFISAAAHAPLWASHLSDCLIRSAQALPKLAGTTLVFVDVSASMDAAVSAKSEITRLDAGAAVAAICREACQNAHIYAFSDHVAEVASYRGLPLVNVIKSAMHSSSTYLGAAIAHATKAVGTFDRIIAITDEQTHDVVSAPPTGVKGYIVNVGTYQNGIGLGPWTRINGWSERLLDYILAAENVG